MTTCIRRHGLLRSAAAIAALCAAPGIARADTTTEDEPHTDHGAKRSLLEEIIVTGERTGSMTAPGMEEMRRRMSRIPGAVDLVGAEEFSQEYVEHLGDMLSMTPGVIAQERYSEEIRLSIRGSGLGLNFHLRGIELLLDGTPINFGDGFGDFQEIDSRIIRALEVYKGGNGFQYGAATLGGAINIVSPTGRTARAANSLTLEGGSFDTARLTGTIARAGEGWDLFVGATGVHSDQFRDHSTQVTGRLTANLGLELSDRVETRFYLILNHINQKIPGSLDFDTALNDRKTARETNIVNDWARDIRSIRIINKTSIRMGDSGQLDVGAYGTARDLDHPIFVFIDDETNDFGVFAHYRDSNTLFGLRHDMTAGVRARRSTTDDDWFLNFGGKRGPQIRSTEQQAGSVQTYVNSQLHLGGGLALDAGLQGFVTGREFTDNFEPVNDDDITFSGINPKIGLLWDVADKVQIWTNVSRSEEPPSFSELIQRPILQFAPVASQEGWTAEIGTRGSIGAVAWDVTFFRAWLDGELLQFAIDGNIPANTFNADDTVHQGIEAGLQLTLAETLFGRPGSRLTLENAYTLSDFFFDGDQQFGDNTLPVVPRHLYNGNLRYEEDGRFHLAVTLEWAPKAPFVDFANTLKATDYAVFGLEGGAQVTEWLEAYVNLQNITDKRFIQTFSTTIDASAPGANLELFTPGDGIGVFAGLRAAF